MEIQKVLFHSTDTSVNSHVVVVQDDKKIVRNSRCIVQSLEGQTTTHRAVTNDCHNVSVFFFFEICTNSHT